MTGHFLRGGGKRSAGHLNWEQSEDQPEDTGCERQRGKASERTLNTLGVGTHPPTGRICPGTAVPSPLPQRRDTFLQEAEGSVTSLTTRTRSRGSGIKVCPGIPTAGLRASCRPHSNAPAPRSYFCPPNPTPPTQTMKPHGTCRLSVSRVWGNAS